MAAVVGDRGVVLSYFGDGAIHQGAFHESLNLAKIWDLPIVYICENNQYGMGTDFRRVSSVTDFSAMGASYGIAGRQVNGMDVLAVYDAVAGAAALARDKGLPAFLEIKTYRYRGHSMSDPAKYRSKEEVEEHRRQDPILILRARLEDAGMLAADDYAALEEKCVKETDDAVAFAERSADPALETLFEDVLA